MINLVVSSRIGLMQGEKGKIVGLFAASVGIGASFGPMLGGLIGDWIGVRGIFLAFIPFFLALAWAANWEENQSKISDEPSQEAVSSI